MSGSAPGDPGTIAALLAEARCRLRQTPFGASPREAQLLLGWVLGRDEADLLAHGDERLAADAATRFAALLARRCAGEPVAYLTGRKEFYGRTFLVDQRVLIPRPETEHLVELAISLPLPEHPSIVDLGTGSGCLAVTLALELPGSRVVALDRSPAALALARHNARRLGAGVVFALSDWTQGLDLSATDLVVANPPYLAERDAAALSTEVRDHEPAPALFAGQDGLDAYRQLLLSCRTSGSATLLLELGAGQRRAVSALARQAGWNVVGTRLDLAGWARVLHLSRSKGSSPTRQPAQPRAGSS